MLTPKYIRTKVEVDSIPLRNKLREAGIESSHPETPSIPVNHASELISMLENMGDELKISTGNAKADLV